MNQTLIDELKQSFKGEYSIDPETLKHFSRDASIYEMTPQLVVFPKDSEDIQTLVEFVNKHRRDIPHLSLTPRAAGTCMSGGPLSNSIVVSVTEHMNKLIKIDRKNLTVTVQPECFIEILKRN